MMCSESFMHRLLPAAYYLSAAQSRLSIIGKWDMTGKIPSIMKNRKGNNRLKTKHLKTGHENHDPFVVFEKQLNIQIRQTLRLHGHNVQYVAGIIGKQLPVLFYFIC